MQTKFMTAAEAAQLIQDGDTVGLMGGGGGLMEATHLFEAVQQRFLGTQQPKNLTVMHALGIGDKKTKGMNCFAHEGLVKRVIGGHWVWSPAMQQLALSNKHCSSAARKQRWPSRDSSKASTDMGAAAGIRGNAVKERTLMSVLKMSVQ